MSSDFHPDLSGLADDFDFPVAPFLRGQIRDGRTLSRTGGWWSAVLLLEDERTGALYVAFYRWQLRDGVWKRTAKFACRTATVAGDLVDFLNENRSQLP